VGTRSRAQASLGAVGALELASWMSEIVGPPQSERQMPERRLYWRRHRPQRWRTWTALLVGPSISGAAMIFFVNGGIATFVAQRDDVEPHGAWRRSAEFLTRAEAPNACNIDDRGSRSVEELRRPTMCTIGDPGTDDLVASLNADDLRRSDGAALFIVGEAAQMRGLYGMDQVTGVTAPPQNDHEFGLDPPTSSGGDRLPAIAPTSDRPKFFAPFPLGKAPDGPSSDPPLGFASLPPPSVFPPSFFASESTVTIDPRGPRGPADPRSPQPGQPTINAGAQVDIPEPSSLAILGVSCIFLLGIPICMRKPATAKPRPV
jgi:hypothetical protein